MHAEMVIILLLTLVVAQIALVEWKKRHYKSYSVEQMVFHCKLDLNNNVIHFVVCDVIGTVDHSNGYLYKEFMVAFYLNMDDIHGDHSISYEKSDGKASCRNNTKVTHYQEII